MSVPLPEPVRAFFALFPLHTWPAISRPKHDVVNYGGKREATLWILPPPQTSPHAARHSHLSADLQCLKWQAYIALLNGEGRVNVGLRWDVASEGGIDGELPSLHVHDADKLLGRTGIAEWVGHVEDDGERNRKDEKEAWVELLENSVKDALIASSHASTSRTHHALSLFHTYTSSSQTQNSTSIPLTFSGISSLLRIPSFSNSASKETARLITQRFDRAIGALAVRLGDDTWFLGSQNPAPLDALAFGYLHRIMIEDKHSHLREEVKRHHNLVAWERRVRRIVEDAFR